MNKQQGFVSIIVASILMILLSLVTIGFSQLMQREQRQALDRQLSSQAFYAAETAVNDVYNTGIGSIAEKTTCATDATWDGIVDSSEPAVGYTCLLIDPFPDSLEYDNGAINVQTSKTIPLKTQSGDNFRSLEFSWSKEGATASVGCTTGVANLPASLPETAIPLLRIDLVPLLSYDRQSLIDNTRTIFLYPTNGSGSGCSVASRPISTINLGDVIQVPCDTTTNTCSFEVTMPNGSGSAGFFGNNVISRIKSIYGSADLKITGTDGGTPEVVRFVGAQTVVDSTGKANDVLRRIKVRLSDSNAYSVPEYALQIFDGICKQIEVTEASASAPASITYPCPNP